MSWEVPRWSLGVTWRRGGPSPNLYIQNPDQSVLQPVWAFLFCFYILGTPTETFFRYVRYVRPFVLAFDRNGGARFGGAGGGAGPHRFDQMQNESIFFNFWRRAAHRRQKSKKMRNENFWSRAQIKVQVMTMISVQFSSKSELSSGIFDPVKVCEKVSVRVPLSKMPSWIQNRNRHVCMALEQLVAFVIELLNLSRKKLKLTMFRRMPLGSAR